MRFSSILGRRDENEDTHLWFNFNNFSVAAVCDGHGGSTVSRYLKKNLQRHFEEMYDFDTPWQEMFENLVQTLDTEAI